MISYRHDTGAWLNAAGDHAIGSASEPPRLVRDDEMTPCMALEDFVDLKLGHYNKDGIEVVDVEGEIDVYTAPRLRELLIDLVNKNNYQLVVNMEKVEFLDSTGLGVLVCTQERILKIFRITGLTKVFGIHDTVDQAIAAKKSEK